MARRSAPIPITTTPRIRLTCVFTSALAGRRPPIARPTSNYFSSSSKRLQHVTAFQTGIKRARPDRLSGRHDAAHQEPDAGYLVEDRHRAWQGGPSLQYADRADVQPGGSSPGTDCRVSSTRTPQTI